MEDPERLNWHGLRFRLGESTKSHFLLHLPACWKISELLFDACKCQPENSEDFCCCPSQQKKGTNVSRESSTIKNNMPKVIYFKKSLHFFDGWGLEQQKPDLLIRPSHREFGHGKAGLSHLWLHCGGREVSITRYSHNCWILCVIFHSLYFVVFKLTQVPEMIKRTSGTIFETSVTVEHPCLGSLLLSATRHTPKKTPVAWPLSSKHMACFLTEPTLGNGVG